VKITHAVALTVCIGIAGGAGAQGQATPDQMVETLKQHLQDSQKRLRQYEWTVTTAISLKGEEKSRKQERAFYGADGKLTKIPMDKSAPPAPKQDAGGRRSGRLKEKIVENKKDEMQEYMERASALIHQYVPPDSAQIQKAKDAGKMLMRPQEGMMRVEFADFIQPSDRMTIDVDPKAVALSAIGVATHLDKPEAAVTLNVRFGALADGTSYTAQTTLDAKAKNIRVVIENSEHRPRAQ
jgi:hypothetical protein